MRAGAGDDAFSLAHADAAGRGEQKGVFDAQPQGQGESSGIEGAQPFIGLPAQRVGYRTHAVSIATRRPVNPVRGRRPTSAPPCRGCAARARQFPRRVTGTARFLAAASRLR